MLTGHVLFYTLFKFSSEVCSRLQALRRLCWRCCRCTWSVRDKSAMQLSWTLSSMRTRAPWRLSVYQLRETFGECPCFSQVTWFTSWLLGVLQAPKIDEAGRFRFGPGRGVPSIIYEAIGNASSLVDSHLETVEVWGMSTKSWWFRVRRYTVRRSCLTVNASSCVEFWSWLCFLEAASEEAALRKQKATSMIQKKLAAVQVWEMCGLGVWG